MSEQLPEEAQERDLQRTFIFSLAGFSFAAVVGMAVLEGALRISLKFAAWYVLVSFVALIASLNLQSYKSTRWQGQIGTGLLEVGTLALMLSLVALMFTAGFSNTFRCAAGVITLLPWMIDHLIRLMIDHRYLAERAKSVLKGQK